MIFLRPDNSRSLLTPVRKKGNGGYDVISCRRGSWSHLWYCRFARYAVSRLIAHMNFNIHLTYLPTYIRYWDLVGDVNVYENQSCRLSKQRNFHISAPLMHSSFCILLLFLVAVGHSVQFNWDDQKWWLLERNILSSWDNAITFL